ncbi:vWA domain-containing protein [Flavobacterium taihuense]|uniref:BatA and WFA domain-containing protein n=1 Tax=Flavobacterium taihuense TaxID=2857508 RepID=A0ABS6XTS2_9FLAO|nr:BatA and WFA domain-containing protein [Flavobacterium taihuense]MBW4360075.1 BatA and WFA domain-containing protein [Flavobacterium taihuense]
MHFKQPEILFFLFLLIVPILVHLFQLRRFKKEYFTNVRFLKALSIQTRKSSKIKKWLLLACRMLLLTCIILAFAQPFFESKDIKNANNEMYIILDNSFSMQAKGKKGELLKRAVQELLEETPENTRFSLLTNTDNYWNTDIKTIRSELQNLKYSATPFQLDNIIAKVKAHKSAFKKDIVIITDAVGLTQNQLKNIGKDDTPYFIIPKAEQKNNVAIDSVFIRQTLDDFYELSINTTNYGTDFKPVPVALYNQNKLIAKTIINFKNKKQTINFTIPKQAFHGYVSIEDNDLAYDNKLFFSISNIKKTNIISIGAPEKNNFLARIYTSDEFNYSSFTLNSLDYNSIDKQDAIVLNELDEIPQALQTTLKAFVNKGGNLIVIPSETASISNLNTLVNQFGSTQFQSLESNEKLITKINFSHPLFAGVFENKTNNFQYPKTKKEFTISNTSPAVLTFEDQSPFLIALRNAVSSVYIFSAPINTLNSNFQQSPLIVPVFYKMALSEQNNGINANTIGNNTSYLVSALLSKDEILTVKNTEEQFIPVQQLLNNKVQLFFNDYPEKAGNYMIYNSNKPIENISFNYARTESNLDQVNESTLSDYKTSDSISTIFDTLQTSRSDNQIWKWFIIFALLFLALEMAIIKFVK